MLFSDKGCTMIYSRSATSNQDTIILKATRCPFILLQSSGKITQMSSKAAKSRRLNIEMSYQLLLQPQSLSGSSFKMHGSYSHPV